LEHTATCEKNSSECVQNWFFYFPQARKRIQLSHLCFIVWNGKWIHATCRGKPSSPSRCEARQFATCMTNKQKVLHRREAELGKKGDIWNIIYE
jgi:hypothetical protein